MMRKYLFTVLIIAITSCTYAQQATVKFKFIGANDQNVKVQLPVDGTTFYPARANKQFGADSTLTLNFAVEKIANVFMVSGNRNFRFLIAPGQTAIELDLNKKDTSAITYRGKNAKGQLLINSRKNVFYQNRASKYLRLDSTATGVVNLIAADQQKELKPYVDLLHQKKISQVFFDAIKADIDMDYIAITAFVPIEIYFDSQRANSKVVFKDEFKELWKKTYEQYPFNNPAFLNAAEFYYHAEYYSNYYVGMFVPQVKGTWVKPNYEDGDQRLRDSYIGFAKNFTGKTREYLMASFLFNEMFQNKYQAVLVSLFDDFKKQYPISKFSPLLQPAADVIVKYHQDIKKDFAADQKFVANYRQVNSLDDLMAMFKGKTVFVDIWATWCGPCKVEFEYGEGLDKFLKSKNAEMLYISTDKDAADQQWKDMIKYYKLAGNHIRTNDLLLKDLISKLWGGKGGYSIPRYLILKDGKLVVPDALRPSDKQKLYDQIATYL
ncbi:MAG TPA: TlpA disulfide reductase family protein [Pedobacter sp.]|nr:TlpA disulfide reductase family protein [Pedobacter sp.]